jgi:hypothetical protein
VAELELIYPQIINDGVVERAAGSLLETSSSLFYKVKGFKELLANGQEADLLSFHRMSETNRSIHGHGIVDAEDDVFAVQQSLTDLDKVDTISLRRLALVTGIPLAILVGESVQGLNATGETEKRIFLEMIEAFQTDYLESPINELMAKLGKGEAWFKQGDNQTPMEKALYESAIIDNAVKLMSIGEDSGKYLTEHDMIPVDDFEGIFPE